MKFRLLFAAIFFYAGLAAQEPDTDSLWTEVREGKLLSGKLEAALQLARYYQLRHFDSAILAGEKGLELARKNGDSLRVAEVKRITGVAHYFSGKYEVAARLYQEAISILEAAGNKDQLAITCNEMAKLYRKTRDLDRSLAYYNKAETIFRQLRDKSGLSMIMNESGVVFEYRKDYAEALRRYGQSLQWAMENGDSLGVSYALSNQAGVYVIQERYTPAVDNLLRALRIRQELKDSFAMALTYSDLGVAFSKKGDAVNAGLYLEASNQLAASLRYPELMANNFQELSDLATRQGDYRRAYEWYVKRTTLRDSLFNLEKTKEIQRLSTQYETARKEQQIAQQQNRIRLQNYLITGIAALVALAALLGYSYYRRYRLKKESQLQATLLAEQEKATKAILEAEENERQRIARDLHDGVGQLMSAAKMNLSAFETELPFTDADQRRSFERVIQLVDESCREVRTVSHIMMPNALLRNNLGEAIREFIHKLGLQTPVVDLYTEGLENRLESNMETVLYRVVQECVHNVIKHAGATRLDISLIRDADGLSGTVEDNGKGFETGPGPGDGIGLRNIRSRIQYLKGTVEITSAPGQGTLVAFHVPV